MQIVLSVSPLFNIPELRDPKTLDARRVANAVAWVAVGHVDLLIDGHLRHKIAGPSISVLPLRINTTVAHGYIEVSMRPSTLPEMVSRVG